MPPSNAMENDKKRLRNQFTKDERTRLLSIMNEYSPLLDDKNISILSRKEIWEIIENKFNENGHSGRTSAQLKKYWQNYKYHSKRTKIVHKEVSKPLSPMTKHMVRMLAKVNPEDWAQYDVAVNAASMKKSPAESSVSSPTNLTNDLRLESKSSSTPQQRSSKLSAGNVSFSASDSRIKPESSGIRGNAVITQNEITESNVVVSRTDMPGSSVTVSVICPEVSSKARSIFWKRNITQSQPNQPDGRGTEVENSDNCSEEMDVGVVNNTRSGRVARRNNYGNRLTIDKSDDTKRKNERYHQSPSMDDPPVQRIVLPSQNVCGNKLPINIKTGGTSRATNQSELIGNVIGVVEEIPTAKARPSKNCDSTKCPGSSSTAKISAGGSILNPFSARPKIISRENRSPDYPSDGKIDADYSELSELLRDFGAVKKSSKRKENSDDVKATTETLYKAANDRNSRDDFVEDSIAKREDDTDTSNLDFLWLKLYLKLLRSLGQAGRNWCLETPQRFESLISATNLAGKRKEDNGESSDCSDRTESEQGMEVDGDTIPENEVGKLRVKRVPLIAPDVVGNGIQREIKVETEIEPEAPNATQNSLNDNTEDNRVMNSMNYLVQAKLRFARSELDHQLKLQKLEVEEKVLRVRIAEMTIQEATLRIQALVEERLRATELHKLRLAQMASDKVRSEAEHAARIDASCTATAEGRARINGIERERERLENFYQMQLRCMSAGTTNGNCGVKCNNKQYEQ